MKIVFALIILVAAVVISGKDLDADFIIKTAPDWIAPAQGSSSSDGLYGTTLRTIEKAGRNTPEDLGRCKQNMNKLRDGSSVPEGTQRPCHASSN
jgi:hypothetical protein